MSTQVAKHEPPASDPEEGSVCGRCGCEECPEDCMEWEAEAQELEAVINNQWRTAI